MDGEFTSYLKTYEKMQEKYHLLMSGYFMGSLTEQEQLALKNHLESTPADKKIFEDYHLLWEQSGQNATTVPIDTDSDLKQTKRRIIFKRKSLYLIMQRVAAILLLSVLFSASYIYFTRSGSVSDLNGQSVVMQEITSCYGIRSQFQLSDGTKVYLNSGSKLIFPLVFGKDSRRVQLIGEAYFEVTPNPDKPFVVKSGDIAVRVLGTSFDLQAYPGSNEVSTTIVHGKVLIEIETKCKSIRLAELEASGRAVLKIKERTIKVSKEEDLDKFVGWKDGKLVFFNDPIEEVAEKLGNWYNVKVIVGNNDLKRFRFTATFSDEPIEQVLDLLCSSSPIKYKISKAVKQSDNSFSRREIIFK